MKLKGWWCITAKIRHVCGKPEVEHVSTSYVELQSLTMRMSMKRFTRLSNPFSKTLINHRHALALYFYIHNLTRIHKTQRVTPAMAAGLTDRLWTMEEIIGMMDAVAPKPGRRKTYKKRIAA